MNCWVRGCTDLKRCRIHVAFGLQKGGSPLYCRWCDTGSPFPYTQAKSRYLQPKKTYNLLGKNGHVLHVYLLVTVNEVKYLSTGLLVIGVSSHLNCPATGTYSFCLLISFMDILHFLLVNCFAIQNFNFLCSQIMIFKNDFGFDVILRRLFPGKFIKSIHQHFLSSE